MGDNASPVAARLRRRAAALRVQSWVALTTAVVGLGAGIYVFFIAGDLAKREDLSQMADRLSTMSQLTLLASQRQAEANQIWARGVGTVYRELLPAMPAAALSSATGAAPAFQIPPPPNILDRVLPASTDMPRLISTVTTRIGAVLILIFLVQILLTTYRYTLRLAAFYDARADALELLGTLKASDLAEVTRALAPDAVEFDAMPASPRQTVVDVAKDVLAKR